MRQVTKAIGDRLLTSDVLLNMLNVSVDLAEDSVPGDRPPQTQTLRILEDSVQSHVIFQTAAQEGDKWITIDIDSDVEEPVEQDEEHRIIGATIHIWTRTGSSEFADEIKDEVINVLNRQSLSDVTTDLFSWYLIRDTGLFIREFLPDPKTWHIAIRFEGLFVLTS